jgi:hypothetical protein
MGATLVSCSEDEQFGSPIITKITKTNPASIAKDSTFVASFPGQMIVIHGENFQGLRNVYFNGMDAYFNSNYTTSRSIVITIPEDAPTAATNPEVSDNITIVTTHGEATFNFRLLVDAPEVLRVSNEFADPGNVITLYGRRFYVIEKVLFPGNVEASILDIAGDSILTVQVPNDLQTGGDLVIVNEFGSDTVSFRDETGMISNFDDLNPYGWGATAVQESGKLCDDGV